MITNTKLRPTERTTVVSAAITCKKFEDAKKENEAKYNEAIEKLKSQYAMDDKTEKAYQANLGIIKSYMGDDATPDDIVEVRISKTQNGRAEYERKTYVPTKAFEDATITRRNSTSTETSAETNNAETDNVEANNREVIEDADQEEIIDFDNEF